MAPGKPPEKHPKQHPEWHPPRGIRYSTRDDRPKAFRLHWRADGKRKSAAFDTAARREEFARKLASGKRDFGTEVLTFDPKAWRDWLRIQELVDGRDVEWIVREWFAGRGATGQQAPLKGLTVKTAVTSYLKQRSLDGDVQPDVLSHIEKNLERFVAALGGQPLAKLQPDQIDEWLRSLVTDLHFSPYTVNSHRRDVTAFLRHEVRHGRLTRNPCELVKKRKVPSVEYPVMAVKDGAKLLCWVLANNPKLIGRLAGEMFIGLRPSSAGRMAKDDVKIEGRGVLLPAEKIKTKKRHYIDGVIPDPFFEWLKLAPEEGWALTPKQYQYQRNMAFVGANVPHPKNVLRHSFCSYHMAAHKNAVNTAYLLCHKNQLLLWDTYKGNATQPDGLAWCGLTPEKAAQMAKH